MAGRFFSTGALAALLRAALDQIGQGDAAFFGIQHADPFRSVEFVRGQGQHIDIFLHDMNFHMAHRLYGVGMKEHALVTADFSQLRNGLDGADLVIGVHDGYQSRIGTDGGGQLVRMDDAVFMRIQKRDLKAALFSLSNVWSTA